MTRNELIEAYQNGRISRRAFIRGMTALGLSASVATALADKVRAMPSPRALGRSGSAFTGDTYDTYGGEETGGTSTTPSTTTTTTTTAATVTTVPATGAGAPASASVWTKPLAVLGAGAAIVAAGLRRIKGNDAKAE